ncbi:MAG: phospholipase A1 [Janthinobacterium sp.]|jgi:phospholipase A1
MKMHARSTLFSSLLMMPVLAPFQAQAAQPEPDLLRCAVIGNASARLSCYDALANAEPANVSATEETEATEATVTAQQAAPGVTPSSAALPSAAPSRAAPSSAAPSESTISRTVQRWELEAAAKRGKFAFRPHRDNYLLLANYSNAYNEATFAEASTGGVTAQHVELTYQLSFKMKMAEQIAGSPVDLWFGYTQKSFWQAYNRAASSPFRETNYQPELMAVVPLRFAFAGIDLRYLNFGLVHQSNGQTGTLSRSWNRVYTELGVERGNFSLAGRIWRRLDNAKSDDDNPDILDFMGHSDVQATYRARGHEYSMTARHNFSSAHGSIQAGWAFPVSNNLKGYLQLFSGYGQSLIDYNTSQKSLGAGFLVDF